MGLFDKIKDNARDLSMKAIEATREYDEDYVAEQQQKPAEEPAQAQDPVQDDQATQAAIDKTDDAATPQPKDGEVEESVEFLIGEAEPEQPKEVKEEKPAKDESRKSKITEISKEEYESGNKAKKAEETKQAAKERLAKSYTPSYKNDKGSKSDKDSIEVKKGEGKKPVTRTGSGTGIIDIAPKRPVDTDKRVAYARERAALSALASQRKLTGKVPLYVAAHMNFKTRVFIDRIEYSGSFGKNVVPIDQVAWLKLRYGGTGVIIETNEGKRIVMVVKQDDRLAFADAVIKVQALQPKKGKFKDKQTVRIDQLEQFGGGVDEIEKLAKLYDKGILSREEFEAKKRQILGI